MNTQRTHAHPPERDRVRNQENRKTESVNQRKEDRGNQGGIPVLLDRFRTAAIEHLPQITSRLVITFGRKEMTPVTKTNTNPDGLSAI